MNNSCGGMSLSTLPGFKFVNYVCRSSLAFHLKMRKYRDLLGDFLENSRAHNIVERVGAVKQDNLVACLAKDLRSRIPLLNPSGNPVRV